MDSTLALLKEEINKTQEAEHDLAKWKIAVVAALGAAALAVAKEGDPDKGWLLLFVPFVCAYIDLYAYQYSLRILVIAQFLREYPKGDDQILRDYENRCKDLRDAKMFSLGNKAGTASSIVLSAIWPVFYLVQRSKGLSLARALSSLNLKDHIWVLIIWLFGVVLILYLRHYYSGKAVEVSRYKHQGSAQPAPDEKNGDQAELSAQI